MRQHRGSLRLRTRADRLCELLSAGPAVNWRQMLFRSAGVGWPDAPGHAQSFVRERPGTHGGVRYQALYDDVEGHRRSAGTFVTEAEATRAWLRAEDRQADGHSSNTRRTQQRFRRYVEDQWLPHHEMEARTRETHTYYLNKHILPVFGSMRINEAGLSGDRIECAHR